MRIALVVPGFSDGEDDWCIPALLNTVRVLAQDHDVYVFTLRYPPRRDEYTVFGARVYALGGGTVKGFGRLPLLWQAIQRVIRVHKQTPFDVVHGLWADEPGYVAALTGQITGIPVVVSVMGGELVNLPEIAYGHQQSRFARWMIFRSLKQAHIVTVGSKTLYEMAKAQVSSEKLRVMPLGADTEMFSDAFTPKQTLAGKHRLLHVASLVPIKNQKLLIDAFKHVLGTLPDAHLHIVGEGVLRQRLETYVKDSGIADGVTFHGNVEHQCLPGYYHATDLCLLTSFFESQSLVALEAAACGRATIGTKVGVLPELIPENWLVSHKEANKLAESIVQLLQNKPLLISLNRKAQDTTLKWFILEKTVQSWVDLYQGLKPS